MSHDYRKEAVQFVKAWMKIALIWVLSTLFAIAMSKAGLRAENLLLLYLVGVLISIVLTGSLTWGIMSAFVFALTSVSYTHLKKVWDKDRVAFVFDHYAPAPTIQSASNHKEMREFARENDLTYHFDINCGVCHQVVSEAGLVYPGSIVVMTDSHTTTQGAFGAIGTGVGATAVSYTHLDVYKRQIQGDCNSRAG